MALICEDTNHRSGEKEVGGIDTFPNTKVVSKIQVLRLYHVLLINDDYTPMEFVVHVLQYFFHKDRESAECIMLNIHQRGIGEYGIYTCEIAEMKVNQVMNYTRQHQHPLRCIMEKK
ncbi:MAG: ATP-dependent Clp protease adapter ClpS [Candidatus Liberibacter ctenarytainae]|uniref:ATP-dependent Clp protease adapter protein ClpS n=1 Tax=Candidatus Liberibacter ctenarytainae TaxID=2020335 RepID=A0A937DMA5_9HYPH|nr:ATP-dependent Clp protease adapter ClpS [Candidatus Liberibacter ctenarytainae]